MLCGRREWRGRKDFSVVAAVFAQYAIPLGQNSPRWMSARVWGREEFQTYVRIHWRFCLVV